MTAEQIRFEYGEMAEFVIVLREMVQQTERPAYAEDEHLEYLDKLRESGVTNMYLARPYLMARFSDLHADAALSVLVFWMRTFSRNTPVPERSEAWDAAYKAGVAARCRRDD